jgi:hypothetical protein
MTGNFILAVSALLVLLSARMPPLLGFSKSCEQSEGSASPVRGYDGGDAGLARPLCQRSYRGGIADAAAFQPTVVTRTAASTAAFRRNPTAFDASFFGRVARLPPSEPAPSFPLAAAKKAGDGSSSSSAPSTASLSTASKRKRKRKKNSPLEQPPVPEAASASASALAPSVPDPRVVDNIKLERESLEGLEAEDALIDHDDDHDDDDDEDDSFDKDDVLLEMKKVAQFEFKLPTDDDDDDTGTGSTKRNVGTCRLGVACAAKIILLS